MAYKDSSEIATDQSYALGEYNFRIERSSVPGSTNDQLTAICTQGGKNARKSIQIPSSQNLDGYIVEANESVATVYALIKVPKGEQKEATSSIEAVQHYVPIACGASGSVDIPDGQGGLIHVDTQVNPSFSVFTYISGLHGEGRIINISATATNPSPLGHQLWTYDGKTVYYVVSTGLQTGYNATPSIPNWGEYGEPVKEVAWTMVYGEISYDEYETEEQLIGRFAIDLGDAGGEGPGSDWIDPGDYDPDWEEGDPTHTLYVEVTGALSGRHNDPIEDPSYSYIPADKDTVKDYGCGGDGGHGGGGGAGASTVVIHKFATNQANFKDVTAIARRHGYGSGGGKGGKGGDGCILVYY